MCFCSLCSSRPVLSLQAGLLEAVGAAGVAAGKRTGESGHCRIALESSAVSYGTRHLGTEAVQYKHT